MEKNTRIVVRKTGNGWCRVTVGDNVAMMRNSEDLLVKLADAAKRKGANGVNWGATSSIQWVGFTF